MYRSIVRILLVLIMAGNTATASQLLIDATREQCARDFWEFAKYCKTRDEQTGQIRNFPTDPTEWKYLHDIVAALEGKHPDQTDMNRNKVHVRKTRQMLVTWLCGAAYPLWKCHQAMQWEQVWGGGCVSKRIEDAKEVMARFKFMLDKLPAWLKPQTQKTENKLLLEFNDAVKFQIFPATESIGRTFTFSYIFKDEWAYCRYARQISASMAATTGVNSVEVMVSTPNGKFNDFYDTWNKGAAYFKLDVHWSQNPERDEAWAAKERAKYNREEDYKREQELSWVGFAGKPVFKFTEIVHHRDVTWFAPTPNTVIYRGWDFGYHYPAAVWGWVDQWDRFVALREFRGEDMNTDDFAREVIKISEAAFPGCLFKDYCDPAGAQKRPVDRVSTVPSIKDQKSDVEIIQAVGKEEGHAINPMFHFSNIDEGLKKIRIMMKLRSDGEPGFMVAKGFCPTLADAMSGGYHYPEEETPDENPEKDGYYDHVVDALRMIIVNLYGKPKTTKAPEPAPAIQREIPATNIAHIQDLGQRYSGAAA